MLSRLFRRSFRIKPGMTVGPIAGRDGPIESERDVRRAGALTRIAMSPTDLQHPRSSGRSHWSRTPALVPAGIGAYIPSSGRKHEVTVLLTEEYPD